MTAYVIARPINGIALNGDEYICGEDGRYLIWETEAEALAAMWKMFNWVDIHNHGIYVKQIELEDEPCTK
jgi:hypothetical protein